MFRLGKYPKKTFAGRWSAIYSARAAYVDVMSSFE